MSAEDRNFLKGLDMADKLVRAAIRDGLKVTGLAVMSEAIQGTPRIPHDEGTLESSGSVFVDDEFMAAADPAGGNPTPTTSFNPGVSEDEPTMTVGFNTPYAAVQHEGHRADGSHEIKNYTRTDGRGPKFLERPLIEQAAKWLRILAERVRKGLAHA